MPTALARRFKVDVSTIAAPTSWVSLKGINDLNTAISPALVGSDDYDSNGFSSFEKTMQGWVVTIKALRKTTAGAFDPGQELVRAAQLQFGDLARVNVRWYDRNGAPEAFTGVGVVGYTPSKTGVADLDEVTITLTGDGILTPITNPYNATAVPVVTAVTPTGKGAGQAVTIYGQNFTGLVAVTGVKFGGTNATDFTLINDGQILAVLPAGSAGVTTVLVTNGVGGSVATNNYTRT